ncbi:MAG: hypothetical protein QM656_07900 [Paracoccaceae bacterium]
MRWAYAFALAFAAVTAPAAAQVVSAPAERAEMNARFQRQMWPCLTRDAPKTNGSVILITLHVGLDAAGRPIPDQITLFDSKTQGLLSKATFRHVRQAVLDCGKDGIWLRRDLRGKPLVLAFRLRLVD